MAPDVGWDATNTSLPLAGLSQPNNAPVLKCSLPAFIPDGLPALPQHVVLHGL